MMGGDLNITDYVKHIRFRPVAATDPDIVYEYTLYRIRHEKYRGRKDFSLVWKYTSAVASLAFLALLSYHLFYYHPEGEIKTVSDPVVYIGTSTLPGTKTCVDLPDGSRVWLNSLASIRYPQSFTAGNRSVELTGEALFEVKKDLACPFAVSVNGMRIEVTGTVFNVYSGLCTDCTEITLVEGSVNLYKAGNNTALADQALQANQQAIYDKAAGTISVSEVNASSFTSWVTREFIFEKATMEEIAHTLERAFGVKIHINNDSVRNMQLNARFTHQETLDKILSILRIPTNYTYVKKDGEIYLR
jgi:ferric-dicitrate binding protein FerR (iron transport regulator)